MFKRVSKKFVFLVGITLGVVPIFSLAQESNQQIKMLQEIQALRTELAELRDMVERQQYKLSRMQGASQAPQQYGNGPYQANPYGQPQQGQITQPALNPNIGNPSIGNPNLGLNNAPQSVNPNYGAPANNSELNQTPVNEYLPFTKQNESNQSTVDNVLIEERYISQSGTIQTPQNGISPVEERSVGIGDVGGNAVTNNGQFDNTQHSISNIQPSLTLNSNGTQNIQPQVSSGTNLNPLYQPPQSTEAPITQTAPIGQLGNFGSTAIPAVLAEKDYYQQGFNLLKQSKHSEAVSVFKQQITSYPQSELADDAHYWIAESMYVNRDLDSAKQYFKVIIDSFAQSPRLPDAMLKTAYIEQEQGNKIEARILLQEIIQYHPRSNAAISAKNRLTELN